MQKSLTLCSIEEQTQLDILGRVKAHKQTTDGQSYTTGYVYNFSGAMVEQVYPSGRVVKNVLDNDGQLSMVQSKKNANFGFWNYADSFTYTTAGAVSSMQLGNGKWESTQFNSRLQPTQIALGTVQGGADKLNLAYEYGTWENGVLNAQKNNGNVAKQTINVLSQGGVNGFTAVQKYEYDPLNRLKLAVENIDSDQTPSWKQTFTFDRYGNRNFDEANTTTLPKNCGTAPNFTVCPADIPKFNPTADLQNNRLNGASYVASGNTTTDANARTFVYDAENKQVQVADGAVIIGQYDYDGDGKRVKKIVPSTGEVTVFVYDAAGKTVAEYSTVVESAQTAKTNYLTADHLGSPRIITDQLGQTVSKRDFMPYGEEIQRPNQGSDTVRQKFTSYERDNETDLDFAQARYYSNQHGRFSSADPILIKKDRVADPQKLNLYAYVRNNPLKFVDSTGEDLVLANRNARTTFSQVMMNGLSQAERSNIRVLKNGRVELRNPTAVNTQNASYAYQQIAGIVGNRNLTINVYSVAQGQTAQGVSYRDAYNSAGVTLGSPGDASRDVVIPVGGGVAVAGNPPGSGNMVATTEDTIFAHEVFGHANGNDGDGSITSENNYRRSRTPFIGERSGEDHRFTVEITAPPGDIITTTTMEIQRTITPESVIPLPTDGIPSPKKPEEL